MVRSRIGAHHISRYFDEKWDFGQKAHVPSRNTGTVRPSRQCAVMARSGVPIMKSSWIMESFTPSARISSSVRFG